MKFKLAKDISDITNVIDDTGKAGYAATILVELLFKDTFKIAYKKKNPEELYDDVAVYTYLYHLDTNEITILYGLIGIVFPVFKHAFGDISIELDSLNFNDMTKLDRYIEALPEDMKIYNSALNYCISVLNEDDSSIEDNSSLEDDNSLLDDDSIEDNSKKQWKQRDFSMF